MPSLKIHIDPYTGKNTFFKNQIRIGSKSHSPFRNLTDSSIFGWIYKLPSMAENEMNDKYDLVVIAPEFETSFIRLVMKGQPSCSSFSTESFEVSQSITERLIKATELKKKYLIEEEFVQAPNVEFFEEFDGNAIQIKFGNVQFEITEDTEESIVFTNTGILWHTPNRSEVSRIIHNRFSDVPTLIGVHNILKKHTEQMSDVDRDEYDSLLLTEPCILPSITSEIEVGSSSAIRIKLVPQNARCPKLKVTVDNPSFVISDHNITANEIGEGTIFVSRENNPEESFTFPIRSFRHNYVTAIKVSAGFNSMECGSQQPLSVVLEPSNAEDADKLSIMSENPDVLRVINGNTIEAVNPGKATIFASCGKCSERLLMEVLPKIESVKLDIEDNKECRVGECLFTKLITTPIDASHHTIIVESSNPTIIAIEKYLNDEYHIKAKCFGKCEIVFSDENGTILNRQSIHVISTLYKKKRPSYTAFIALVSLLSSIYLAFHSSSIPDFVYGILLIGSLVLSLWSIFKEKRHYLISILVAGTVIWFLGYAIVTEIHERSQKTENIESTQNTVDNGNRK